MPDESRRVEDGVCKCVLIVYLKPFEFEDPDTGEALVYEPGSFRVVHKLVAKKLYEKGIADYHPGPRRPHELD